MILSVLTAHLLYSFLFPGLFLGELIRRPLELFPDRDAAGTKDIPAGHKVFSFPQLSIREQMAAYKEVIDGSSKEGFRRLVW